VNDELLAGLVEISSQGWNTRAEMGETERKSRQVLTVADRPGSLLGDEPVAEIGGREGFSARGGLPDVPVADLLPALQRNALHAPNP